MPNEFKIKNGLIVDQGGLNVTGSTAISGSVTITGSVSATNFTGSLLGTASWANNATTSSYILNAVSASFASTASSADNFLVRGTLTAQTIVAQTITSSIDYVTGSTRFGSLTSNTHQFTGSVSMTGSLNIIGNSIITGSLNLSGSVHNIAGIISASDTIYNSQIQPNLALDTRGRILYSNFFSTTASLPDPSLYHGMFSHVHNEGAAYYSHGSNGWIRLWDKFNYPDLVSSSQVPSLITGQAISPLTVSASSWITASGFFGSGSGLIGVSASYLNPLNQTVLITGSVNISGSTTITGTTIFRNATTTITGSLLVSGSTTQIGNNTLLGNTTLSGSIIISGSQGPGNLTASVQIYGDIRQTGYHRFDPVNTNIDTSISASYIYVSGSTNDLYFSQNGSGFNNVTRLRWLEGNLYTGLLHGGLITATVGSTTYQISSGSGIIVNLNASYTSNPYPIIQYVNWGNLTGSISAFTSSFQQVFVGIDSTSNIFAQGTPFSNGQFDNVINIGLVLFQNGSTINAVKTQPSVAYGFEQQQNIFNRAFGPLKLSGYTLAPSGSSTRSLIVASGTAYSPGSNYAIDPNEPSYTVDSGTNVSKIYRYRQSGSTWVYDTNGGAGYTAIDPTQYSNNGVLTAVPGGGSNKEFSIQRVFYFPNSVAKAIVVYYGNATYASLTDATSNISFESFVEAPNTAANAVYLGAIIVRNDADFTVTDSYAIQAGGLFRSVGGAGGGGSVITQTLAGLSDVSISSPTSGQALVYDTTAAKWENKSFISASISGTSSFATTASYAQIAVSASYFSGSISTAVTAQTASYITSSGVFGPNGANSILSSSFALTASYWNGTVTSASYASSSTSASFATTASYVVTASYVTNLNKKVRTTIPIIAASGQSMLITNIPSAVDEVGTELRVRENLLNASSASLSARIEVDTTGNVGFLRMQYSTDEITWNNMNASLTTPFVIDLGITGSQITTEEAIPSGAKTTGTYLRLVTSGGTGASDSDARFGNVTLNIIYDL